ncbi:hypothetical protein FCM33_00375 [Mycoplasma bovis]|nr:hypothetical protein [Mycoplasmopsis bovis]MBT1363096.1 hypothetical protein [Mycoplasmopsis bovis]
MIAASCGVKKKDVETSNSEKQDLKTDSESNSKNQESKPDSESNSEKEESKPNSKSNSEKEESKTNSESNSEKEDSKTNSESNSEKEESKPNSESNSEKEESKPNSKSNSEKEESKTNSESNSKNQESKPDSESNSGNQGSKTNGSSNKSTRPIESIPNDMPTENSEINDYLKKVKEYGKEANLLITLIKGTGKAEELLNKYAKFGSLVKVFLGLYEGLESDSEETKKQTEEYIRDPENKNNLIDFLKQYERSKDEIKAAIEELKSLKKEK